MNHLNHTEKNEALELPFPKLYTFVKLTEALSINCDPKMTKNEHVYAICCRLEVDDDVVSGKKYKDYPRLNGGRF